MKINKVLNNNVVVVKEGLEEIIVMGSGLAFGKRKNDVINPEKIEKVFVMQDQSEYEKFTQITNMLPEEHIALAEEIITHAERRLQTNLNEHVHVALADHVSFAIERIKQGFSLHNKLLQEIKALYSTEFEIGLWAIDYISKKTGIELPEDEAGHLALHIHTAKMNASTMNEVMNTTVILHELISIIEQTLHVKVEEESISYQRLMTHLNFALKRVVEKEPFQDVDPDMHQLVEQKYAASYKTAEKLAQHVKERLQQDLPASELVYLTLHIQRIEKKKTDEV
ncbi:BglG family transcription antiterminator LicT [Bacillus sp. FJAT-45037]|uniref:BglG family transcription antiterminator LicT n=1 Tax=Bacillus sp. FJAT-45037 TaxID=2011007 RepID=UPI000C2463BE|nr:PRD domain-containing protein [Bacillus sp. FJAT-45037]